MFLMFYIYAEYTLRNGHQTQTFERREQGGSYTSKITSR